MFIVHLICILICIISGVPGQDNVRDKEYKCPVCIESFGQLIKLDKHMVMSHNGKCPDCLPVICHLSGMAGSHLGDSYICMEKENGILNNFRIRISIVLEQKLRKINLFFIYIGQYKFREMSLGMSMPIIRKLGLPLKNASNCELAFGS